MITIVVISLIYLKSLFTLTLQLILGLYILFLDPSTGTLAIYDAWFRLNSNDFFWVNYYFFWTTFTYLPLFFSSLSILLLSIKFFRSYLIYSTAILAMLLIYTYETFDLLLGFLSTSSIGTFFYQLNTFLLNSLNKYHPFLLYWGLIGTIALVLIRTHWVILSSPWCWNQTYNFKKFLAIRRLYPLLIALGLGSWWAFQEGTWGGWWNWDPSEVFGLLFLLMHLLYLHELLDYRKFIKVTKKVLHGLLALGSLYFFIQLNFEIISHNFGVKFFFFFNNNLFLIMSLVLLLGLSLLSYFQTVRTDIHTSVLIARPLPSIGLAEVLLFLGLLLSLSLLLNPIILSFAPTFQYFTQTYFDLNLFNFDLFLGPTTVGLGLGWVFIFTRLNSLSTFTLTTVSTVSTTLYTIFTLGTQPSLHLIAQLHLLLGIFLALTTVLPTYSVAYPLYFGNFQTLVLAETLLLDKLVTYTLNGDLVEVVMAFQTPPYFNSITSWQLLYGPNTLTLNAYLLVLSNLNLTNYYILQPNPPLLIYLTETQYTQSLIIPLFLSFLLPYLWIYAASPKP